MSEIKLEVGKTYKSRKGEEVEIVDFCGEVPYPYKGNKGMWYRADGRWANRESHFDLIEEVIILDANQKHNRIKQIKLEVGKTYRSREGKEVKIVSKNNQGSNPYQGRNGWWYAEDGRWRFVSKECPEDLIEEVKEVPETCHAFVTPDEAKKVTGTRYTFAIPDGVTKLTVEQVSNRIIVEMVPEAKAPKPGDVMVNEHGSVYVFKAAAGNNHLYYVWLVKTGWLLIDNGCCAPGSPATPEEAQPLFDALKKAGKRWNPETMQVEEIPESTRILEWAMEHYSNYEGIAEAIGAYLKHKDD